MPFLYVLIFANNKKYIGITTNSVASRYRQHKTEARCGTNRAVYNAWRKHGEPDLQVLAELEDDDLAAAEVRAIAVFGTSVPFGYNTSSGGDISPMKNPDVAKKAVSTRRAGVGYKQLLGKKMSPEVCAAMSARMLGKKLSPETKAKVVAAIRARPPQSQETIEKRKRAHAEWLSSPAGVIWRIKNSEQARGRQSTERVRQMASVTHKGKILSEETKKKVAESQRRRLSDPSARTVLADAARKVHTGRKRSEETRQKMRDAWVIRRTGSLV